MNKISILSLVALLAIGIGSMSFSDKKTTANTQSTDATIDKTSSEAFDVMMQVITHKRCVNCHPSGDRPRQGEDSHIHYFNVQRGEDGHGNEGLKCQTCHQKGNNDYSGVPGAPHWHLAPKSMAWEGMNRVEIAKAILDKTKNGGRSLQEIEKHLTEDPLVLWAFDPGINNEGEQREKPPVSKEAYLKAVKQWVAEGAIIPNE